MVKDLEWLRQEVKVDIDNLLWRNKINEKDHKAISERLYILINQVEQPEITHEQALDKLAEKHPFGSASIAGILEGHAQQGRYEQPELAVIPPRVAELIEQKKAMHYEVGAVFVEVENARQVLTNELSHLEWVAENQNLFARVYLNGYIVGEKKYKVEVPDAESKKRNKLICLRKLNDGKVIIGTSTIDNFDNDMEDLLLTENEIRRNHDYLWPFAEEVEK